MTHFVGPAITIGCTLWLIDTLPVEADLPGRAVEVGRTLSLDFTDAIFGAYLTRRAIDVVEAFVGRGARRLAWHADSVLTDIARIRAVGVHHARLELTLSVDTFAPGPAVVIVDTLRYHTAVILADLVARTISCCTALGHADIALTDQWRRAAGVAAATRDALVAVANRTRWAIRIDLTLRRELFAETRLDTSFVGAAIFVLFTLRLEAAESIGADFIVAAIGIAQTVDQLAVAHLTDAEPPVLVRAFGIALAARFWNALTVLTEGALRAVGIHCARAGGDALPVEAGLAESAIRVFSTFDFDAGAFHAHLGALTVVVRLTDLFNGLALTVLITDLVGLTVGVSAARGVWTTRTILTDTSLGTIQRIRTGSPLGAEVAQTDRTRLTISIGDTAIPQRRTSATREQHERNEGENQP